MKNLKKCEICKSYTLKPEHCSQKTKDANYKFIKNPTINRVFECAQKFECR